MILSEYDKVKQISLRDLSKNESFFSLEIGDKIKDIETNEKEIICDLRYLCSFGDSPIIINVFVKTGKVYIIYEYDKTLPFFKIEERGEGEGDVAQLSFLDRDLKIKD